MPWGTLRTSSSLMEVGVLVYVRDERWMMSAVAHIPLPGARPADAARVIVAAETGLRPEEWIALERREFDRQDGRSRCSASTRRGSCPQRQEPPCPSPGAAHGGALEVVAGQPPRVDTALLFPAPEGGYLGLENWRTRCWYPALEAAGISKRGAYHLRHTFATEGRRRLHPRAVTGDGHLDRDDRYPRRTRPATPRTRSGLTRRVLAFIPASD
jgi:integrase